MSLEEYADKFRPRNKYIPEQLYVRLAKLENIAVQQQKLDETEKIQERHSSGSSSGASRVDPGVRSAKIQTKEVPTSKQTVADPGRVTVTLRRSDGDVWSAKPPSVSNPDPAPNPGQDAGTVQAQITNQSIGSIADNVSSFLSGIRASFRTENVNVMSMNKLKKNSQAQASEKD